MKRGSFWTAILLAVLILLVVGLWLYPSTTKDIVTGAFTKVKNLVN